MNSKLILVEDDATQLKIMGKIISSYFPEIEIAGEFLNATEALEYIHNNACDIVISDIKLPGMSGLELAEICSNHYPNIKFIITSAYRDFQYAKDAIKFNVLDYILKPINPDALCPVLSKIVTDKQLANFSNEDFILNRSLFFSKLMTGSKISQETIIQNLATLEMTLNPEKCSITFFRIDLTEYFDYIFNIWHYEKDRLITAIINVITKSVSKNDYVVIVSSKYNCLQCLYLTDKSDEDVFNIFTDNMKKNLNSILKLNVSVTELKNFTGITQLSNYSPAEDFLSRQLEKTFNVKGELPNCDETIVKFTNLLSNYKNDLITLKSFCFTLSRYALNTMGIEYINSYAIDLYSFENLNTYDEMENFISSLLSELFIFKSQENYNEIIIKAINYVKQNLRTDITLENVASYVSQSPSYFSKYFKKITGENFTHYVNRMKMQTAMKLLKNDPNIKIVSVMREIGYDNPATFFRNFKSFAGYTPTEYRQKFL